MLAPFLGASCRQYVHFSKTYLEAPRSKLCKAPLDIVLTRARSGMGAGSVFKNLVGLSTLDNIESSHEYVINVLLGACQAKSGLR